MKGQLIKALAFNDQIRVFVVDATELVKQAQEKHQTWHTATAALGRTLVATALLSANLKGDDRLLVQIKGSGPLGLISCDGDTQGRIRGYVSNPKVALELNSKGKLDVAGAIGLPGSLKVSKYLADSEPFTGQVELISGELGEDFTYYMALSEQTPSSIGLSVLVNPDETVQSAGGFMIQVLPGTSDEVIDQLETKIKSLGSLSDLIDGSEAITDLLDSLVGPNNSRVISQQSVEFYCPCSKERFTNSLAAVDPNLLQQMIDEDKGAEIVCQYCNATYQFSEEELKAILAKQ
ncbi:Hsp33 family molecular chaperone HslO [Facklamia sp. 7083-14-GEN3]|uniref:Hsp33 family molecular chaperone HslO n=1 Tax=Facklamia sp. 7083-14-GEN3 TaxID=2973478 RepID=UPI00215BE01D|nr:Hsp33 family molecular chaperone HslO [Facklamia sp. 7083-14-GEN3]MCR8969675.1 Hsp33 family molecular chaperone HslO [Facklamia sp. 7083-14-GEN3]